MTCLSMSSITNVFPQKARGRLLFWLFYRPVKPVSRNIQ